ncbi:MAG: branched-chain amino acid transport system substrate-binding protein, partial [Actinomycetota bacterium]
VVSACSSAKKDDGAADVVGAGSSTTTTTGVVGADGVATTTTAVSVPGAPDPKVGNGGTKTSAGGTASPLPTAPPATATDVNLYSGAANTRGITKDKIVLCAHAALTYGPAFNATADDFNVYYQAINDQGGVYGRKIEATYENDNYDPATAVQAAEACKAKNPAFILGGIGFDQIPSVRTWAEQNRELYFHHIATEKGAAGKQFSYTTQPSVEAAGRAFGELAVSRFKSKKIGVLYRNSEFWQPGYDAFKQVAKDNGLKIVLAVPVEKNQANYTQALVSLRNAGAEVVFGWENTIALTEMVKQAKAQSYSPQWLAFPFNLTAQTLGDDAMTPKMIGLATWPGYSAGDYGGTFQSYAADMKEFEREYAKYRPNTDLSGVAGDLLWLNWVGQRQLVALLQACGPDCTRNRIAGVLAAGWKTNVSPGCPIDFSGGVHDGSGSLFDVMETYRSPSGKVNWRSTSRCQRHPK